MHQPWASLVALGAKRVETRSWTAPADLVGQRIAIHANKTKEGLKLCEREPFSDYVPDREDLPLGAIVCTAVLDRCAEITEKSAGELERAHPDEFSFGDYTPGRFAWVFRDVERLDEPVEFKAHQGINEIDDALLGIETPQEALL